MLICLRNNSLNNSVNPKIPRQFKPQWILCHNLSFIHNAVKLVRGVNSKLALIIHNPTYPPSVLRTMFPFLPKKNKDTRELLQRSNLVISVSDRIFDFLRQNFQVTSHVVHLGCNPSENIPALRGDFILCASRISLGKRVDKVADIIAIADPNAKVVFAGRQHRTTWRVIKRIRNSGLRKYEIILNPSEDLLGKLYSKCRFFVGFSSGLPPLEAASHGAPFVVDRNSWANEYFRDGVHGYIHDENKQTKFECAEQIRALLEDERKAWKMGYRAWCVCVEKYTWEHHISELLSLLAKN